MGAKELSELNSFYLIASSKREVLEKFERSKILEIYFARLDGRLPEQIPEEYESLYAIDLPTIKSFLMGQHPQDPLLQKVFRMMN